MGELVEAWPSLALPLREGILAMIRAVQAD